jgi:hypothetical protein
LRRHEVSLERSRPLAMSMPDAASVRASAASCAFCAMAVEVSRLAT